MYLGQALWKSLESHANLFTGEMHLSCFQSRLQLILKKYGVVVEIVPSKFAKRHLYLIGGEFLPDRIRQPIRLYIHVHADKKTIKIPKSRLRTFLFEVSQVTQHELIHKFQYSMTRDSGNFYGFYYLFETKKTGKSLENMYYMATVEEIDAYAHDIAMEIKFYYPDHNPATILKHISRHKNLTSWNLYTKSFRGAKWSDVRVSLIKRIYKWIPAIKETFILKKVS